jgi:ABC-type multidrug transport system fused ATPase/permease subunit
MKKIIISMLFVVAIFANSLEERVDSLEQEVSELKSIIYNLTKSQKKIESSQKVITQTIKSSTIIPRCDKIKLKDFSFEYNDGYIKSYDLHYNVKNEYNKTIKFLQAYVIIKDSEDDTLIRNIIKRDVNIPVKQLVTIDRNFIIESGDEMAPYLKNTPKKELNVKFNVYKIIFEDGTKVKCDK